MAMDVNPTGCHSNQEWLYQIRNIRRLSVTNGIVSGTVMVCPFSQSMYRGTWLHSWPFLLAVAEERRLSEYSLTSPLMSN